MLEIPRTTLASSPTELLDRPFARRSAGPGVDRWSRVIHVLLVAPRGARADPVCTESQRRTIRWAAGQRKTPRCTPIRPGDDGLALPGDASHPGTLPRHPPRPVRRHSGEAPDRRIPSSGVLDTADPVVRMVPYAAATTTAPRIGPPHQIGRASCRERV